MAVSTFILRVELINADSYNYDQLHAVMAGISFYRVIAGSKWLDLPTGTYAADIIDNLTAQQDAQNTEQLVSKTLFEFIAHNPINEHGLKKDYTYFLSKFEYGGYRLFDNTDPSKVPS